MRIIPGETVLALTIERPLPLVTHNYTKYRATIHPFLCRLRGDPLSSPPDLHTYRWLSLNELDSLAFSAGHRQVISSLQSGW